MTRLAVILWLFLAVAAQAQAVRVTTGEHDGFTRLVFDFGQTVDWKVGRSADGYVMQINGGRPRYDLRAVFNLIGRSRLAAIWADPSDGSLRLGLACACHALPFEFRSGVVVIDLRDGPPPKGSSFELALDGTLAGPLPERPMPRPRPRPALTAGSYDWLRDVRADLNRKPAPPRIMPELLPPDPDLNPLREALLHQMARGAAQGVVDMARPAAESQPSPGLSMAQVRIGEAAVDVRAPDSSVRGDLGATGKACLPAAALDLAVWGDLSRTSADQLAESRARLVGEFDQPDAAALQTAVRLHLYLGFGAEARQLIKAFSGDTDALATERALGHLIDDFSDPEGHFAGLAACDGPSALWAVLGTPPAPGDPVNTGAVRLAFSGLPPHLRTHLGPPLAERFLAIGDSQTAQALREALERAPVAGDSGLEVMGAQIDLGTGHPEKAEALALAALKEGGPDTPVALLAFAKARIAQRLPVTAETALALQAALAETGDSLPDLARVTALALAASGDFDMGFAQLGPNAAAEPEIWALLAELAPDDALLRFAVLDPATAPPSSSSKHRRQIAERLLALGLPEPAAWWLRQSAEEDPLLAARIALARGDATGALAALGNLADAEAEGVRRLALARGGQSGLLADRLAGTDETDALLSARAQAGDWAALASEEGPDSPWRGLARLSEPMADPSLPPLAQAAALVTQSASTRQAATALIAAVPRP